MDGFVLGIFVDEIINQCEFALISSEYLQESLKRLKIRASGHQKIIVDVSTTFNLS